MNENTGIPPLPPFQDSADTSKEGQPKFFNIGEERKRAVSVLHFPFSATFQREIFQKSYLSKFYSRRFLIHEEFAIFVLLIFYFSVNNFQISISISIGTLFILEIFPSKEFLIRVAMMMSVVWNNYIVLKCINS